MQDAMLPLFPLQVVLLPHNELPLHIFEDRYKEMIGTLLEQGGEFGVVLAAEEGIVATGCTAVVAQVLKKYPDGRMDIVTVGQRRFRIQSLNQEKEYLRGAVEFFDDDDSAAPLDLRRRAVRICEEMHPDGVDAEEPELSFRLAGQIQDLQFRQEMLMMRSETERLRKIVDFVPGYRQKMEEAERMKELAPKNGHGRRLLPPENG